MLNEAVAIALHALNGSGLRPKPQRNASFPSKSPPGATALLKQPCLGWVFRIDALRRTGLALFLSMRRETRKILWRAYSFATGFAADILALASSAALSVNVRAAPRGIVIAALVMEVPLVVFGEAFSALGSRMERATSDESKGGYAVLSLTFLCLALAWMAVGLAIADLMTNDFNITGTWPYVGTLALVAAATLAVYLPMHVRRRMARR